MFVYRNYDNKTIGCCFRDSKNFSSSCNDNMAFRLYTVLMVAFLLYVSCGSNKDKYVISDKKQKENKVMPSIGAAQHCDKCRTEIDSIKALHRLLDDDHNGNVDQEESDEFIRDELKYIDDFERQSKFHSGDKLISVEDLWQVWQRSEVHNWTTEDVVDWLDVHVELGQYSEIFKAKGINGSLLPRVAVNSNHFLSEYLGIKNSVHRHKLSLKAIDIVLFGPPKKKHSYIKDLVLILCLIVAVAGCWFAYTQYRYCLNHERKMVQDLDSLQRAEDALTELQNKLDFAEQSQLSVAMEKENMKQQFCDEIAVAKKEASRLRKAREGTLEEISRLKLAEEELHQVRSALLQAENQLENRPTLIDLQPWLQMTHEIELHQYQMKKVSAEKQLASLQDYCFRLRKKRANLLGSFRSSMIDEIDVKIASVRSAFDEVRQELQERQSRWAAIENICKFHIVQNSGLPYLCSLLQRDANSSGTVILSSGQVPLAGKLKAVNMENYDEDFPLLPQCAHHLSNSSLKKGAKHSWSLVRRYIPQIAAGTIFTDTFQQMNDPVHFTLDLDKGVDNDNSVSVIDSPTRNNSTDSNKPLNRNQPSLPTLNESSSEYGSLGDIRSIVNHKTDKRVSRSQTETQLVSLKNGSVNKTTSSQIISLPETSSEAVKVKKRRFIFAGVLKKEKIH